MDLEPLDLTAWLAAGIPEAESLAYLAAGCADLERTLDLRQTGITPEQMAASGLGPAHASGDASIMELLSVLLPEAGEGDLKF